MLRLYGNILTLGGVAQLGERLNGIQEVMGSIPTISTKNKSCLYGGTCFFICGWGANPRGFRREKSCLWQVF